MAKKKENYSILDKGLIFDGVLTCKGEVIINGTVKGTLEGDVITVGEEGAVYADTKAGSAIIGGIFEGTLEAREKLEIRSTARCSGKVICRDLMVESGGILNAEVIRLTPQEPEKNAVGRFRKKRKE